MQRHLFVWLVVALAAYGLTACASSDVPGKLAYEYVAFSGVKTSEFDARAGEIIALHCDVVVDKGSLTILLVDPQREIVWGKEFDDDAEDVAIDAIRGGTYSLVVEGVATAGSFDVTWKVE